MEQMSTTLCSRIRRWITETWLGQHLCPCLKVRDISEKSWSEMNKLERRYRIKSLWVKARLVHHFIKIRTTAKSAKK